MLCLNVFSRISLNDAVDAIGLLLFVQREILVGPMMVSLHSFVSDDFTFRFSMIHKELIRL